MAGSPPAGRRRLAGRAGAVADVVSILELAGSGRFGALLVAGDAGVGKTALVAEACAQVAAGSEVVWGTCLPLGSRAVPFLPLASAVRAWSAGRDEPEPLAGAGLPSAGPVEFDAWLGIVGRERPAVLVMDDLQWADQSSLDALMYVIAGPANRRLAVVGTIRREELADGHPVLRWLADVRRLPGVGELLLEPLDRAGTAEQLMGLLGQPPHESLLDDVFARTRGNPYLTSLVARDLAPGARSLPADLPSSLRDAVTRAWQGLSPSARELIRVVAVGGRPQIAQDLAKVADAVGIGGDVPALLREATGAGVLAAAADGAYWFVHPLLAEVLESGLLPDDRRLLHAAFATVLEPQTGPAGAGAVERAVNLADHHYAAGDRLEAYRWALTAADAAERAGGSAETVRLLRRALDLLPDGAGAEERVGLLHRIRAAADRTGNQGGELAAVEDMLALVDRGQHPLLVSELLVRRSLLRFSTGKQYFSPVDMREAVRISADYPASAEYAIATAQLADAEMWNGIPDGPARAAEAVVLARSCGSDRALSFALTAYVDARISGGDPGDAGGADDAAEAQDAALRAKDYWAFAHATMFGANLLDCTASDAQLGYLRRGRERLAAAGGPHTYVAWLSAVEASGLLLLGRWRECAERLREVLGSAHGPMSDLEARLVAGQLALRQGRLAEARGHIARAEEVVAELADFRNLGFDAPLAELAIAEGDVGRAVSVALASIQGDGVVPTMAERLVPLAAQAIADEAQRLRDRRADPQPALARLADLRRRFPAVVEDEALGPMYSRQVVAMQDWYDGEAARCEGDPEAATAWRRAALACGAAELAWDEAYCWWRAAEAWLRGRTERDAAATALRRAHVLAVDLEAAPLRASVEALASGARISLAAVEDAGATAAVVPGLTPREREVLALLVAGRTYGQIARELVVSEKTVSVHISNLLRKTGTASRGDLAQLIHRLQTHP